MGPKFQEFEGTGDGLGQNNSHPLWVASQTYLGFQGRFGEATWAFLNWLDWSLALAGDIQLKLEPKLLTNQQNFWSKNLV